MTVYHINDKGEFVPKYREMSASRGAYVISDTMPGTVHPVTGKMYDSKSEFRKATRAAGCVEVGNDVQRDQRKVELPPLKADIARAIESLSRR